MYNFSSKIFSLFSQRHLFLGVIYFFFSLDNSQLFHKSFLPQDWQIVLGYPSWTNWYISYRPHSNFNLWHRASLFQKMYGDFIWSLGFSLSLRSVIVYELFPTLKSPSRKETCPNFLRMPRAGFAIPEDEKTSPRESPWQPQQSSNHLCRVRRTNTVMWRTSDGSCSLITRTLAHTTTLLSLSLTNTHTDASTHIYFITVL